MEATGGPWSIARLLAEYAQVLVADARPWRALSQAKGKTDRADARSLAELGARGLLTPVWIADDLTRALRRLLARPDQLARQRCRTKNEIHAALHRDLLRSPVSDLFGRRGRRWLMQLELPAHERHTVESCLRQVDLIDEELAAIDRAVAERALGDERIRRLMTIPGVDVVVAAALVATIGDIDRFDDPGKLTSYLGLDPTVRQSGSEPAKHGRISKQGSSMAGRMLVEAASTASRAPPGRHAPSTPASAPAAEPRSPLSPPPASSPRSPGTCSATSRTTPTRGRRSRAPGSVGSSGAAAPPP